jgi:hypothetical protein
MVSSVWREILERAELPKGGVVVEIAPGFKSKIGQAAAEIGFAGDYHVIEPSPAALLAIRREYRRLMPRATLHFHAKYLHQIRVGLDVPASPDGLFANHALDDMVLAKCLAPDESEEFFAMNSGPDRVAETGRLWGRISERALQRSVAECVEELSAFHQALAPKLTVFSHYEGRTLAQHGIKTPNRVGHEAVTMLRRRLRAPLCEPHASRIWNAGYGRDWIVKASRNRSLADEIFLRPRAIGRLSPGIFCAETARQLPKGDYEVVYANRSLLSGLGYGGLDDWAAASRVLGEAFAYRLGDSGTGRRRTVYSDRQADPTDIALSGNEGSGRACYLGSDFNIKGIGRTRLVKKAADDLHGTGNLDLVTALREAMMSDLVNRQTAAGTSPVLAVLALREKHRFPWSREPLTCALLVRLDRGSLDRISHLAYAQAHGEKFGRDLDFMGIVERFARFDAEMFARRLLHGAWSTGNASLSGQWLDMESVSSIRGRGARCNITKKYLSNHFGYESLGIKQALRQLADGMRVPLAPGQWEQRFDEIRGHELAKQVLWLIGLDPKDAGKISAALPEYRASGDAFEILAKKISPRRENLNVFEADGPGTHLLDFSAFFRKLPKWYREKSKDAAAARLDRGLKRLVRSAELEHCRTESYQPTNAAEECLSAHAVIDRVRLPAFLADVKEWLRLLERVLDVADDLGVLPPQAVWERRVALANADGPSFLQATDQIRRGVRGYESGKITARELDALVHKL